MRLSKRKPTLGRNPENARQEDTNSNAGKHQQQRSPENTNAETQKSQQRSPGSNAETQKNARRNRDFWVWIFAPIEIVIWV